MDDANRISIRRLAKTGEIDIMEHVGFDQNRIHQYTVHLKNIIGKIQIRKVLK